MPPLYILLLSTLFRDSRIFTSKGERAYLVTEPMHFKEGDRVRIDIPDQADPDFERFHGKHGVVIGILDDDAGVESGDARDSQLYRVELDIGKTMDFRWRDLRPP